MPECRAGIRREIVRLGLDTQLGVVAELNERTRHAPKSQPPLLHTKWGLFSSAYAEQSSGSEWIVRVVNNIEQLRRRWWEKLTYHFAYAR